MIKNKKLLIDRDCPMCKIYGKSFTRLNWIDADTLQYYQTCKADYTRSIDMERAKSEIALHDAKSGKTEYGIDAFIQIIWNGKLAGLLKIKPIYWLVKRLYRFVSFNRKVIAPPATQMNGRSCAPPLHRGYRILYILISVLILSLGINSALKPFSEHLAIQSVFQVSIALATLPFILQSAVLSFFRKTELLEYLGNMATVSNISAILIFPPVFIYQWMDLSNTFLLIAFLLVSIISFKEIQDRTRRFNKSSILNITWALFYVLTAFLILTL